MRTITLKTVLDSQRSLQLFFAKELDARTAFELSKIFNKLKSEIEIYGQHRENLCQKYGKLSEDKSGYELGDNADAYHREHDELLKSEISLQEFPVIDISRLDIKISPSDMAKIQFLFEA